MRCPTCGRGVRRDQELCSFCGAFLREAYLAEGKGGVIFAGPEQSTAMQKPTFPSVGMPEPEFEEIEPEEFPPAEGPFKASPKAPPAAPPPPARPALSGLLRLLFPLLFILIPLLNFLLRDTPLRLQPDERPVLQQALFCENIAQGRPVNPKTVFFLRQNQRVVLYTRWSGSRGNNSYTFRWYTPEGNLLPASSSVTRFQLGQADDSFSTYAFLPLNVGMPLGRWRVAIEVDQVVQSQPTFELRE